MKSKPDPSLEFDKYHYYIESVQSPDADAIFFRDTYKEIRGKEAKSIREDFCAAFAISCEWVKLGEEHKAYAIDLDEEPLGYGRRNYLTQLTEEEQSRLEVYQRNVLDPELPKVDMITASNFSYFIFKKRTELKEYFQNAYNTLDESGLFIVDCFGGSQCQEPIEEETEHDGFSYFWDQDSFDPVTNHAQFFIHFKRKGEAKRKAFSYDWRMWSIPEVRDLMLEVGFKDTYVYWEKDDDETDEGSGEFYRTEQGEPCEAWVCYIVGIR